TKTYTRPDKADGVTRPRLGGVLRYYRGPRKPRPSLGTLRDAAHIGRRSSAHISRVVPDLDCLQIVEEQLDRARAHLLDGRVLGQVVVELLSPDRHGARAVAGHVAAPVDEAGEHVAR